MRSMENCPVCFYDLRGSVIPGTDPPQYYNKIIGIEISDLYDGVLFWECPNCDSRFHRFEQNSPLWRKAEPYVRRSSGEALRKAVQSQHRSTMQLEDGKTLTDVHNPVDCEGRGCAIHHPSNHPMKSFPRTFIDGMIMRICPHNVEHPDPDSLEWLKENPLYKYQLSATHDCCRAGCCSRFDR